MLLTPSLTLYFHRVVLDPMVPEACQDRVDLRYLAWHILVLYNSPLFIINAYF